MGKLPAASGQWERRWGGDFITKTRKRESTNGNGGRTQMGREEEGDLRSVVTRLSAVMIQEVGETSPALISANLAGHPHKLDLLRIGQSLK